MTTRNFAVTRIVFVALTVAAIALVSLTSAMAQTVRTESQDALTNIHSYARANYIWPYSTGPRYPAIDIYQQGVIWTPAGVSGCKAS